jgi:endonuclease YncB( thermonuclease family)
MATFVSAVVCTVALVCSPMTVKVIDGDTLRIGDERIRIIGYDAPETKGECAAESRLARRSTARLADLITQGPVVIDRQGLDRFDRTLAHVHVNDKNVAETLLSEGLMQVWKGHKAEWCK